MVNVVAGCDVEWLDDACGSVGGGVLTGGLACCGDASLHLELRNTTPPPTPLLHYYGLLLRRLLYLLPHHLIFAAFTLLPYLLFRMNGFARTYNTYACAKRRALSTCRAGRRRQQASWANAASTYAACRATAHLPACSQLPHWRVAGGGRQARHHTACSHHTRLWTAPACLFWCFTPPPHLRRRAFRHRLGSDAFRCAANGGTRAAHHCPTRTFPALLRGCSLAHLHHCAALLLRYAVYSMAPRSCAPAAVPLHAAPHMRAVVSGLEHHLPRSASALWRACSGRATARKADSLTPAEKKKKKKKKKERKRRK